MELTGRVTARGLDMGVGAKAHHRRARWARRAAAVVLVASLGAACVPQDPADPGSTTTTTPTTTTTVAPPEPLPANVSTLTADGHVVTVVSPGGTSVVATDADEAGLPPAPDGVGFPAGAVLIRIDGVAPGGVVTFTLQMDTPMTSFRKLIDGRWDRFPFDGSTGASLSDDGLTITATVRDGGRGDGDGAANGVVVDPLAPVSGLRPVVSTYAGFPAGCQQVDGAVAVARFCTPIGLAAEGSGGILVADLGQMIRRIDLGAGSVSTLAGSLNTFGSADGTGAAASFGVPTFVAVDGAGNGFVGEYMNHDIRRVTPGGVVTTFVGSAATPGSADGTGSAAQFFQPQGVAFDGGGNLFVADSGNHTIRKVTPDGVVTTFAGQAGVSGSADGTGTAASFNVPRGLAFDGSGNLFVGDSGNHLIRRITPDGVVTTFAGQPGVSGSDDGLGPVALFAGPSGLAFSPSGTLFVTDWDGHTVRMVEPDATVETVAGSGGEPGYADAEGPDARFHNPGGVMVGADGVVWVADALNSSIRRITWSDQPIPAAVSVSAGQQQTCAVLTTGRVQCWGRNQTGQLGDGTTIDRSTPVTVVGVTNAIGVATGIPSWAPSTTGGSTSCALLATGGVKCWGYGARGALGNGGTANSSTPVDVVGITDAVQITRGCARLATGRISCWGAGSSGRLGNGTTTDSTTPVEVLGITDSTDVDSGFDSGHVCAVLGNQSVKCWGANGYSEAGVVTASPSTPVTISAGTTGVNGPVVDVSNGRFTTCALLADATSRCWGRGPKLNLSNVDAVAAGGYWTEKWGAFGGDTNVTFGCQSTGGDLTCSGIGYVGDGTYTHDLTSRVGAVSGVGSPLSLAAAGTYACAVPSDRGIVCWGASTYGVLGTTSPYPQSRPSRVPGLPGYQPAAPIPPSPRPTQISAGYQTTCARMADGTVRCWGLNLHGALGDGSVTNSTRPTVVAGLTDAVSVGVSNPYRSSVNQRGHACALIADGSVRCWGGNMSGQLGNGTTTDSNVPVTVLNVAGATQLSVGGYRNCALISDGTIRCWGSSFGSTPVQVSGITNAVQVSVGGLHACAVLADGSVTCWGDNSAGQLGDGTTAARTSPVTVVGVSGATQVSAADGAIEWFFGGGTSTQAWGSSCAIVAGGAVKCWGDNSAGQIGDGTTTDRPTAVTVPGLSNVAELSGDSRKRCALIADGSVNCWGSGTLTPAGVNGIDDGTQISVGSSTCVVFPADSQDFPGSSFRCWGLNDFGQLGLGTTVDQTEPRQNVFWPG